ncbi:MAG: hypothetical protein K9L30_15855 [Desulfobacterales bacterium]|nr:hypothetical protein [Desulfobacterales bacterium]
MDLRKILYSINSLQILKKTGCLNPVTSRLLLSDNSRTQEFHQATQILGSLCIPEVPFEEPDESVTEKYHLGYSLNSLRVGISPMECHVLVAGLTGSGKSVLMKLLFSQALQKHAKYNENIRCWIFSKNDEMRELLEINKELLIVDFTNIKLNPLEPPKNISRQAWIGIFVDLWQSFRLWEGSKSYLIDCLHKLYKNIKNPDLHDLYNLILNRKPKKFSSRISMYKDGILVKLQGLIHSQLGKVFKTSKYSNNRKSHISNLVDTNVVFEVLNFTSEQNIFMTNYLLTYLYVHKLHNSSELINWVAIDDANVIFDASLEKRYDLGLPIIHQLLSEVRKSKINIFGFTQVPSQCGTSIHSNSAIKIMFPLSNGVDREFMYRSMGITSKEQKEFCSLMKVEDRVAVCKFSLRYNLPFVVQIPEVKDFLYNPDKNFVSLNNKRILKSFGDLGDENENRNCANKEKVQEQKPEIQKEKEMENNCYRSGISDSMKRWLWIVYIFQYKKTITEICQLSGFPNSTGSRLNKQGEKMQFIKSIELHLGRGVKKYPVLTEEGHFIIEMKNQFYGKGASEEHILYQHLIADKFKKYYPVIEKNIKDKFIDVAFEHEGRLICFEVERTKAHIFENIKKDIGVAGASAVVVVCADVKVLMEAGKVVLKLPEDIKKKVWVYGLDKILSKKKFDFLETKEK